MKPQKHYKKVWIESEKDLPKEDGKYIAHSKIYDQIGLWGFEKYYTNEFYPDYTKNSWLHNIDWYLQEVEQPKPTDQDIEKWAGKELMKDNSYPGSPYQSGMIKGAKAMRDNEIPITGKK